MEDLPLWLEHFWKHLCELRGIHDSDIRGVQDQLESIQRTHDRLSEYSRRLRRVEETNSSMEHKVDELITTS